jgi:hypothetical protein
VKVLAFPGDQIVVDAQAQVIIFKQVHPFDVCFETTFAKKSAA